MSGTSTNAEVANPASARKRWYRDWKVWLGIGITVAGVMTMIYYSFAGRGQAEEPN